MEAFEIELGKFYIGDFPGMSAVVLIVWKDSRKYRIGNQLRDVAEWTYFLGGGQVRYGTFSEMDTKIIESLSPVKGEEQIRRHFEAYKKQAKEHDKTVRNWLKYKNIWVEQGLQEVAVMA